jgi:hypothetical protein
LQSLPLLKTLKERKHEKIDENSNYAKVPKEKSAHQFLLGYLKTNWIRDSHSSSKTCSTTAHRIEEWITPMGVNMPACWGRSWNLKHKISPIAISALGISLQYFLKVSPIATG